jgi:hypothetical protein
MPFVLILPAFVIDPLTKPVTWMPVIVVPAGLVQPEFGGGIEVGHAAKAGGTPPPTKSAATELDASNRRNFAPPAVLALRIQRLRPLYPAVRGIWPFCPTLEVIGMSCDAAMYPCYSGRLKHRDNSVFRRSLHKYHRSVPRITIDGDDVPL